MKSRIRIYNGTFYPAQPSTNMVKELLGDELFHGVNYSKNINASVDLQLGQVASAQVTFTTTYASINKNHTFTFETWQDESDSDYRLMGLFYVTNIDKDVNYYTITGYDCICKLDQDISDWLKDTCTATRIGDKIENDVLKKGLFTQICEKCGLASGTGSFWVNTNMPVDPKDIYSPGITARAVMGYIAEATASFVYTRDDNKVHCFTYLSTSSGDRVPPTAVKSVITTGEYSYLNMAREPAPRVTNIAVNTINGTYQSNPSANAATMQFIYNPILYKKNSNTLDIYVPNIRSTIYNFGKYYPCKFKCFSDYRLRCGDIITVNDGVNNRTVLIMSMKLTESGCEFECFGQPEREPFVLQNTDRISSLEANKFNVEEWTSTTTDKLFNSSIIVNDIIIPTGISWGGNNNTSLVAVIQHLLNNSAPVNIDVYLTLTGNRSTYTTSQTTSATAGIKTPSNASFSVSDGTTYKVIFNTAGSYSGIKDGTIRITEYGINYDYNVHIYTDIVQLGTPTATVYVSDYTAPSGDYREYGSAQKTIRYYATADSTTATWSHADTAESHPDIDNTYVETVSSDGGDDQYPSTGVYFILKKTGWYYIKVTDVHDVHGDATYEGKFLVQ